jgi:LPXTG-motif cell wall-anchored protein
VKKCIVFCGTIVLSLVFFTASALAADITITTSGTYTITSTDTSITVASGLTVTLIGSGSVTYDLPIDCGAGVSLTLQDVHIITSAGCPLSFTGSGNQLILTGDNWLQSNIYNNPGVRAENTTALTISGTGTLSARGGAYGAGIGGYNTDGGILTIAGGTIDARGGSYAAGIGGGRGNSISGGTVSTIGGDDSAGIGGGNGGDSGTISISGGTVTATGGDYGPGIGNGSASGDDSGTITISGGVVSATGGGLGAGIGSGYISNSGTIGITGGTVTATGGQGAAGIGGGHLGNGGATTISGGTVIATGSIYSAGIGGGAYFTGYGGDGGTVTVSGGVVYAEGDYANGAYDVGSGSGSTAGTLSISGTSAVFLRNDYCLPPTLPVPHAHKTPGDADAPMQVVNGMIYGITGTGISPWTTATGGYFVLWRIQYDPNGGTGSVPDTAHHITAATATVKTSAGISRTGYQFTFWNTAADGSGTDYPPGSTLTLASPSITLYAQWIPIPKTGDATATYLYLFTGLALLALAGIAVIMLIKAKRQSG